MCRRNSGLPIWAMICLMMSLPLSSRGWALPANTICTGRFWSPRRIFSSRCGSRKSRAPRLYGAKPPGKADRQRLRIQKLVGRLHLRRRGAAPAKLLFYPLPGESESTPFGGARASATTRRRESRRPGSKRHDPQGCLSSSDPDSGRAGRTSPRNPRTRVNPIGDRGDRHLISWSARPHRVPHLPRDVTVQSADPVGGRREP